jgi:hypothetical protein
MTLMNIFNRRQIAGVLLSAACMAVTTGWILSRRRAKKLPLESIAVPVAMPRRLFNGSEQVEMMIDHMMQDSFPASDPPVWDSLRLREVSL